MNSPSPNIHKKLPFQLLKSKLHDKFKATVYQQIFLPKSKQISLKTKKTSLNNHAKNLSIPEDLSFKLSDENILRTPSTIHENHPLSLDLLDQSLSNYYELEVNRNFFNNSSATPVPYLPRSKPKKQVPRSSTPKIVMTNNYKSLVKDKCQVKKIKGKSASPCIKENNVKTRYFSRRERKFKSPRKFVYYYPNKD